MSKATEEAELEALKAILDNVQAYVDLKHKATGESKTMLRFAYGEACITAGVVVIGERLGMRSTKQLSIANSFIRRLKKLYRDEQGG